MSTALDGIIAKLEYLISKDVGLSKSANISEEDVLAGDRTDYKGGGDPYKATKEEMTDASFKQKRPAEDSFDETVSSSYNLTKKREEEARAALNGSVAEKAAEMAASILLDFKNKKAQDDSESEMEEDKEEKESPTEDKREKQIKEIMKLLSEENPEMTKEEASCKLAGLKTFFNSIDHPETGAESLHKVASIVDPSYQSQEAYTTGAGLAELAIQKTAAYGQEVIDADTSYKIGRLMCENAIKKVGYDLVAIRPVLQDLFTKDKITQDEKESLIHTFGSSEKMSPEIIRQAVSGLSNADIVAEAIINAMDGPQGKNVIPQPAQTVVEPTTPPEEAGVDGEIAGEKSMEDNLLIEAALRVLKKRGKNE